MNRVEISKIISARLIASLPELKVFYQNTRDKVSHFYIDDVLPEALAYEVYEAFPDTSVLKLNKTLREFKYITAQMNQCNPLVEEVLFAFQEQCVLDVISAIVGKSDIEADSDLYAGGISVMTQNHYLNPHLDNSHDININMWRVFNLLFYVSPDWSASSGGDLELWPEGVKGEKIAICSKFNRLVVMSTDNNSWHSVSPVISENTRNCISNYYFSPTPTSLTDEFHVTTFRARPGNSWVDLILRADGTIRSFARSVFKKGVKTSAHFYKK